MGGGRTAAWSRELERSSLSIIVSLFPPGVESTGVACHPEQAWRNHAADDDTECAAVAFAGIRGYGPLGSAATKPSGGRKACTLVDCWHSLE
ncbi:hypothetical protein BMS3Bbin01_01103 [bacterium BMS3Bbin01]|nr:hypothetical protein BMS3Bbin01_01103 [bacterium BMS3Bbin01]